MKYKYFLLAVISVFLSSAAVADHPYPTLRDKETLPGPTEENPWCVYQNEIPFVKDVVWEHPD
ncbi:hypothetical protein ACFLRA_02845, partial [Bdellovibrionota bacterium]